MADVDESSSLCKKKMVVEAGDMKIILKTKDWEHDDFKTVEGILLTRIWGVKLIIISVYKEYLRSLCFMGATFTKE